MIILDKVQKQLLIESLSKDFGKQEIDPNVLNEFNKLILNVLREAEENEDIDFMSLKDRLKWFLGKLVNNREVFEQWQQSKLYQELFKDVVITIEEDKINVTIKGQQVSGNTKGLVLVYIAYVYLFTMSFTSIGEQAEEIGGAIIKKASKMFAAEASKRADLSDFAVTGEPLRVLTDKVIDRYPLSNLLACATIILLLDKNFGKIHKELLILAINIVKSMINNVTGYIYNFLIEIGKLYNINTKILALDIFEQFKAIGIYSGEINKTE